MSDQPRKTASQIAEQIVKISYGIRPLGEKYVPSARDSVLVTSIAQALESYLLQESGELVRASESLLNHLDSAAYRDKVGLRIGFAVPHYERLKQALNNFRSRHNG